MQNMRDNTESLCYRGVAVRADTQRARATRFKHWLNVSALHLLSMEYRKMLGLRLTSLNRDRPTIGALSCVFMDSIM
jgi:hypothetical protein